MEIQGKDTNCAGAILGVCDCGDKNIAMCVDATWHDCYFHAEMFGRPRWGESQEHVGK